MNRGDGWMAACATAGAAYSCWRTETPSFSWKLREKKEKIGETGAETHTQRPPVRTEPRPAQRTSGEGRAGLSAGGGAWR